MKSAAKIFIILGMIVQFWLVFPIIIGIFALKKIDTATTKSELTGMAIVTLIFCNLLGGIFMLCINEADLAANRPQNPYGQNPYAQNPYGQAPQAPYGQAPQAPYGQAPQAPYGQAPQAPYGQAPQAPYGQAPQAPYGQDPYAQNQYNTQAQNPYNQPPQQ
ncbi:MAG: hypothetical protein IKM08_01870 [Clostridia bacterium]|nr:hypothetical protein [Clostridia bacterium]